MLRASFRDPCGRTWVGKEMVSRGAWSDSEILTPETLLSKLQAEGKWIPALALEPTALLPLLNPSEPLPTRAWKHPRIFFPSYAYEWSPAMLHCVAELTLELNERMLGEGWELKDATPTNVLFDGPNPIFIDHLSPSKRASGQMGWAAYGQFIRTFLIPLCLHRLNGLPLSWIHLARRDGVSPEDAYRQLGLLDRVRPSVLGLITFPAALSNRKSRAPGEGTGTWKNGDESIGAAITARILKGLRKRLQHWTPPTTEFSVWSKYDQTGESYTPEGLQQKETFILKSLETCRPKTVLDLGCNTGRYSRLAARAGARVVAIDGDPACVDRLWREARADRLDILPLVMDLGRPSPGLGWENGEEVPFLERAQGHFEMVFALALVHHLIIRERVPLERILTHLANQTTQWVILEWIPPEDPQFQRLAGPNIGLFAALTPAAFESILKNHFQIIQQQTIPNSSRILYFLQRTSGKGLPHPCQ